MCMYVCFCARIAECCIVRKRASAINCWKECSVRCLNGVTAVSMIQEKYDRLQLYFPAHSIHTHTQIDGDGERAKATLNKTKRKNGRSKNLANIFNFSMVYVCLNVVYRVSLANCINWTRTRFRMQMKTKKFQKQNGKTKQKSRLKSIKTVELTVIVTVCCCLLFVSIWMFSNNRGKKQRKNRQRASWRGR